MKEIATVVDNNQPGWKVIAETAPNTTLDTGTKLYGERVVVERDRLLAACQAAYRKHHLNDDSIGWEELSSLLLDALCNSMGSDGYGKWMDGLPKPEEGGHE